MPTMPSTMRAVVCERQGPASEGLVFHSDWPIPVRKPNQVLVEVAATSVSAGDWKMRQPAVPIPVKLPKIFGEDMAGVVVEAPEGSKFKKGNKVFACTGQNLKSGDQGGTYGEFVAADEDTLCLMPPGVSFQDAAVVPTSGLTAWQALVPAMPLAGKRVLIHAGAGGVGGYAIQIAKAHGAHVTTTCSTRNVEYVTKELGADVAIDYAKGPWEKAVTEPFDYILDAIGGSYQAASLRLLKPGGTLASLGGMGPDKHTVGLVGFVALFASLMGRVFLGRLRLGPKFIFVMQEGKAAKGLEQLAELMAGGKLKVHLDRVWPLEEMVAAHEYSEQGHVRGKVGILVKEM